MRPFLPLFSFLFLLGSPLVTTVTAGGREEGGAAICQVPPGNPDKFFTTYVGSPDALSGPCSDNCNSLCNTDPCKIYVATDCEEVGCIESNLVNKCDDNDPCTIDDCDGATGECTNTQKDCDDNDLCTEDECVAGVCVNEPIICLATNDACDTVSCVDGECEYGRISNCCNNPSQTTATSCTASLDVCTGSCAVATGGGPFCLFQYPFTKDDPDPSPTGLCIANFNGDECAAYSTAGSCACGQDGSCGANEVCVGSCSGFLCVPETYKCDTTPTRREFLRHLTANEQGH